MVHVASVKQLSDDKVNVLLGSQTEGFFVIVDKDHTFINGSVIVDIVRLSFPIFMGDDVVPGSGVESGGILGRVGTVEVGPRVGGCWDLVPSKG